MVYFANFATSNFCLRGCNAGSLDPNNTEGMFNSAFVACFNWPSWTTQGINSGDSSWAKYLNQCESPNVNTLRTSNSNIQTSGMIRFQGRPFSINLVSGNQTPIGLQQVRYTSPIATSFANSAQGYQNVSLSSRQNSITVDCSTAYPGTFAGWRSGSTSGALMSTVANTSFFFNSNYGGINFLNIKTAYSTVIM